MPVVPSLGPVHSYAYIRTCVRVSVAILAQAFPFLLVRSRGLRFATVQYRERRFSDVHVAPRQLAGACICAGLRGGVHRCGGEGGHAADAAAALRARPSLPVFPRHELLTEEVAVDFSLGDACRLTRAIPHRLLLLLQKSTKIEQISSGAMS